MATGQGSPLTPDLARALTPVAKSIVEPLRQYGVYAAEMETPDGADDAAALLCYLGRQPPGRRRYGREAAGLGPGGLTITSGPVTLRARQTTSHDPIGPDRAGSGGRASGAGSEGAEGVGEGFG